MSHLRIIIAGSRAITSYNILLQSITAAIATHTLYAQTVEIVSGGAQGVDKLAEHYATDCGYPNTLFLPQYEKYGIKAPLRRNQEMATYGDVLIAVWDGKSTGTAHMITCMRKLHKPVYVYEHS